MNEPENLLEHLQEEERQLQFQEFTNKTALDIGTALIEKAKRQGASIVIHIVRNNYTIFHYAFDGTTPDNDRWITMKSNIVSLYGHSSYYMGVLQQKSGLSLEEAFCLGKNSYSASGGCFPVFIKGGIPIGHISVSGFNPEKDHEFIVETLRAYLN